MLLQDKKIAIIGGGPGGLTLARLLQQHQLDVTVYERDSHEQSRVQGAPLDLHEESGLKAIEQAGLLAVFKQNFMPRADRKKIMDNSGTVHYSDHDSKLEENFSDPSFRPEIDRGVLRKILLNSLADHTVKWDQHTIGLTPKQVGWDINFQDGTIVYADFVVACDGANSKIRPYLTDIKAFYTGITMLEGNIAQANINSPRIYATLQGGKIMAFGHN